MFEGMTYPDFYMDRTSWIAKSKGPILFTKEEIEWAAKQTEYKYFGDYEFSDNQKIAVEILVWASSQYNNLVN